MSQRVAVVTGSNKGIGRQMVRKLCERFNGEVYLTARDEKRGRAAAAEELRHGGRLPRFHQLDVTDRSSVRRFRDHIRTLHGGIDILVNNAGVANVTSLYDDYETAKNIIDINYRSLLIVQDKLFPLVRAGGRILNITSDCGHLCNLRNEYWLERLSRKELTVDDINDFVSWHEEAVRTGTFKKEDIADEGTLAAYRVSKMAMSALTILQQRMLDEQGIAVNSLHPGLVQTDMTTGIGFFTPDQATDNIMRVLLDPNPPNGAYIWYDGRTLDWYDPKADWWFKTSNLNT